MLLQQYCLYSSPYVAFESEKGSVIAVNSTENGLPVLLYTLPKEELTKVWISELCKTLQTMIKSEFDTHRKKHPDENIKRGINPYTPRYEELDSFLVNLLFGLMESIQLHFSINSLVSKLTLKLHVEGLSRLIQTLDPTVSINLERLNLLNERIFHDLFVRPNAIKLDHLQPVFEHFQSNDTSPLFHVSFLNYTTYGVTAYVKKPEKIDQPCISLIDHKIFRTSPEYIEQWKKALSKKIEMLRSDRFTRSKMAQKFKPLKSKTVVK